MLATLFALVIAFSALRIRYNYVSLILTFGSLCVIVHITKVYFVNSQELLPFSQGLPQLSEHAQLLLVLITACHMTANSQVM